MSTCLLEIRGWCSLGSRSSDGSLGGSTPADSDSQSSGSRKDTGGEVGWDLGDLTVTLRN